ncbi:MAG: diacylglycerol kinase family protein [Myxococcaceae bacterium]|nr:diacylglycerol kinase family protein [Myxococcaceae bacterium]
MDISVVVNLNARKGSERFAEWARRLLPNSKVIATRSVDDVERFVRESMGGRAPKVVLSGGGDGTAIGLLDAMRAKGLEFPALGLVPLGTGNAWAIGTHAPSPRKALEAIRRLVDQGGQSVPTSDFSLMEVEGRLTPFADAGWGAEILHDYKQQRLSAPPFLRKLVEGKGGYAASIFGRTILRNVVAPRRPRVRLINLGDPALGFDATGRPVPVPGGERGAVLYEGPYGVAGAGTTMELGFGFKALHFARTMPGRMHTRVYAATAAQATGRIVDLWRGVHPIPHSHDFLLTQCRMEFDGEVPVEVGGDVIGLRRQVEFRVAPMVVPVVDWSKLRARA